jgi:RND family efflux transporter MFP subunit
VDAAAQRHDAFHGGCRNAGNNKKWKLETMKASWLGWCVLLMMLTACGGGRTGARRTSRPLPCCTDHGADMSRADVVVARPGVLRDTLPFTGTLAALKSSSIAAEVEARVEQVLVREGETVRPGQVLARLDSESLDQSVSEQQAQLAGNQSRLKLARIKLDKQHELLQKGFISQLAYDEAESEYTVRQGELQAQSSQLARARRQQADSVVRAPIAGVVYERKINPGEIAAKNARLFSIADLSVLELSASVPSQWIGQIKAGQQARFSVEGLPDE